MSRPAARILEGVPPPGCGPLELPEPASADLRSAVAFGVVSDEQSATAALDTVLRGGEVHIYVQLVGSERGSFMDQLSRVADVQMGSARLSPEEAVLVDQLRAGASLQEAARAAGVSRRTAARRLEALRRRFGVRTVAELVVVARR